MKSKNRKIILISIVIVLLIAIVALIKVFIYDSGKFLEFTHKCESKVITFEERNVNTNEKLDDYKEVSTVNIVLENYKLSINKDNRIIWKTSDDYKVQNFLYCDIDRDDENELVLLLWKKGLFGTYKPSFAEDDKNVWSQHVFIYDYKNEKVNSIWCASKINITIKDFSFDDADKVLHVKDYDNMRTRFVWDSFGLYNIGEDKFDYDEKEDKIVNSFNINAFGDNLIHHQIYEYGLKHGDFDFIYENIKDGLDKNDINVINQETMFVENDYSDYPRFGTPLGVGESIINAGFNLITLANNHTLDKLYDGVKTTCDFYDKSKIDYIGATTSNEKVPYKIINKNGIKIAVFNWTYNINKNENIDFTKEIPYVNTLVNEKQVIRDLNDGVRKADLSIVFVHWGTEYRKDIDAFQKKWSKIFLENGVDIVIGTHPHVLQDYEILKDKNAHKMLVYYSLGNFVSYQAGVDRLTGGNAKIKIAKTNHGVKIASWELNKTITNKSPSGLTTVSYY